MSRTWLDDVHDEVTARIVKTTLTHNVPVWYYSGMKHFHFNMVAHKALTACGLLGTVGETNSNKVTCKDCIKWLNGKSPATPTIRK